MAAYTNEKTSFAIVASVTMAFSVALAVLISVAPKRDAAESGSGLHRYLRAVAHRYGPENVGRRWRDVTQELDAKYPVIAAWENGSATHKHYLVKECAYGLPNGDKMDLVLKVSASCKFEGQLPCTPGDVYAAEAALVAGINMPYSKVLATKWFPEGSVFDVGMRILEVEDAAYDWPLLGSMSVNYDSFFDRWGNTTTPGFWLEIMFVATVVAEVGEFYISVFVPSGLDPVIEGSIADVSFVPSDTLGKPRSWGGGETWYGTDEQVRANQMKYLGKLRRF